MNPAQFFAYRFFWTANLCCWFAGLAILVFRQYRVNYPYVLQVRSGQISPWAIITFAQMMSVGYMLCRYLTAMFWNVEVILLRLIFLTVFGFFISIVPMKKLHGLRLELLRMTGQWSIGPFAQVNFRSVVMSTVYLTLRPMMIDGSWLFCLYTSKAIITGANPTCSLWMPIWTNFILLYVYVVMFSQRMKRYYVNNSIPQLLYAINIGQYITGLCAGIYGQYNGGAPLYG